MAAKVVARHRVGGALEAVAALRDDPVPRVRAAAAADASARHVAGEISVAAKVPTCRPQAFATGFEALLAKSNVYC
jgi:hypothetical protein